DAAGRALRVRLPANARRQRQTLFQRNEVRPFGLEDDAVLAQVQLGDDVVLYAPLDRLATGKETATDPVRDLAQAQVEARRLHVLLRDREAPGIDDPRRDRALEVLARQHAGAIGGENEIHGRSALERLDPTG